MPKNFDANEYYKRQAINKAQKFSNKNPFVCVFLALFHLHYFYVGRIGRGVVCLLTLNFLFVGTLMDLIVIACGRFKDANGKYITTHRMAARIFLEENRNPPE